MLKFKDVEKVCNEIGIQIIRGKNWPGTYQDSVRWKFVYKNSLLNDGRVFLGDMKDEDVKTINGEQYIIECELANKINFYVKRKQINVLTGKRFDGFFWLFKRHIIKIKKQVDDMVKHLAFLEEREKIQNMTGKLIDMDKDFK